MHKKRKKLGKDIDIKEEIKQTIFQEELLDSDLRKEVYPKTTGNGHEIKFSTKPHGRITSVSKATLATQNAGRNIGQFYTHVYSGLFNHEREADYKHKEIIEVKDERIQFNPDIKLEGLNERQYIEVKGKTLQEGKLHIGKTQIETYSYAQLKEIKEGNLSLVNFAIFRYGDSHTNLKLHSKKSTSALEELARETKEGIVLPLNLLLFLLPLSTKKTREREYEKDQTYFCISGRILSILRKSEEFHPMEFIEKYKENLISKQSDFYGVNKDKIKSAQELARKRSLCLNELVIKNKMSSELRTMHYNGTNIVDFPVTIYCLKNPQKWAESFFRNQDEILKKVKLRNLYKLQEKNNPF